MLAWPVVLQWVFHVNYAHQIMSQMNIVYFTNIEHVLMLQQQRQNSFALNRYYPPYGFRPNSDVYIPATLVKNPEECIVLQNNRGP